MKTKKVSRFESCERRPWPCGGSEIIDIYAGVGAALSAWERLESSLADIFAKIVGGENRMPARRAFCAVRTFQGRSEMLRAAALSSYAGKEGQASKDRLGIVLEVLKFSDALSPRRNDIAHGYADRYAKEGCLPAESESTFGLFPSFASFRERDINYLPTYCLAKDDIDYFVERFSALSRNSLLFHDHYI